MNVPSVPGFPSTLCSQVFTGILSLGMAGSRRSSTLIVFSYPPRHRWGWPGVAAQVHWGGRYSPLSVCWGWPGVAAQVHLLTHLVCSAVAGDGRESPLKYTSARNGWCIGPAGDGRESPLKYTFGSNAIHTVCAGDGRESPLKYTKTIHGPPIRLAGDGRESPLKYTGAEIGTP